MKTKLSFKKAKRILTQFAKDYSKDKPTEADIYYLAHYLESTTRNQEKRLLKFWEKITGEIGVSSIANAMSEYM